MLAYEIVRDQESFSSYSASQTQAFITPVLDSDGNTGGENSAGVTVIIGVDRDTSYTISQGGNNGAWTFFGSGVTLIGDAAGANGATTSVCLTMSSTASSSSFSAEAFTEGIVTFETVTAGSDGSTTNTTATQDGSSMNDNGSSGTFGTTSQSYGAEYQYPVTMTSSGVINITDIVNTTTSQWTVTGLSGRSWATTESASTTAISNYSSSVGVSTDSSGSSTFVDNNEITQTFSQTYLGASTTSEAFGVLQEVGTVVIADADWLWSFHSLESTNTAYSFIGVIADSFLIATFWPVYSTQEVTFFEYGTDGSMQSFSFPAATNSFALEYLTTNGTATLTMTSGDNFPRDTYTTTAAIWTTSSTSATFGQESYVIFDYSTAEQTMPADSFFAVTVYSTYQVGLSDVKTTSLLSTSSIGTTTTSAAAMPAYESFIAGGEIVIAQTNLINLSPVTSALGGGNLYCEPVPPVGAFLAPQMLVSGSNMSFGGNLSFEGGGSVYFPFLSGVYSNVSLPGYGATASTTGTASGEDARTWKYSWKTATDGATLLYSEISTFVSGTATASATTASSGQFLTSSELGSDFVSTPGIFGGYAYNKEPETAYFAPRAVIGTSIGTDGSSTTYQSIYTETSSTTLQGTLVVEATAAAYLAYQANGGAAAPYVVFERNPD